MVRAGSMAGHDIKSKFRQNLSMMQVISYYIYTENTHQHKIPRKMQKATERNDCFFLNIYKRNCHKINAGDI